MTIGFSGGWHAISNQVLSGVVAEEQRWIGSGQGPGSGRRGNQPIPGSPPVFFKEVVELRESLVKKLFPKLPFIIHFVISSSLSPQGLRTCGKQKGGYHPHLPQHSLCLLPLWMFRCVVGAAIVPLFSDINQFDHIFLTLICWGSKKILYLYGYNKDNFCSKSWSQGDLKVSLRVRLTKLSLGGLQNRWKQ